MCVQAAVNEKPFVVPEIQQWKGAEGTFSLVSSTTVTFNDTALEPVAQYLVQGVSLGTKAQEGKRKPNGIHIQIEKNKKLEVQTTKRINEKRIRNELILTNSEIKLRRQRRLRELYLYELEMYEDELSAKGLSIVKER